MARPESLCFVSSEFFLGSIQTFAGIFSGINLYLRCDEKFWKNPGWNQMEQKLREDPKTGEKTPGKAKKLGKTLGNREKIPFFHVFNREPLDGRNALPEVGIKIGKKEF